MRRLLGAGGAVLLGAAVIALVGVGFSAQAYSSPRGVQKATSLGTDMTCGKALPHVTLSFATYADASGTNDAGQQVHPGGNPSWPTYGPTNIFQAPAHACVTMHITQYDSGGSLNNPVFAKVQGTIGDTESVVSSGNSDSGKRQRRKQNGRCCCLLPLLLAAAASRPGLFSSLSLSISLQEKVKYIYTPSFCYSPSSTAGRRPT